MLQQHIYHGSKDDSILKLLLKNCHLFRKYLDLENILVKGVLEYLDNA